MDKLQVQLVGQYTQTLTEKNRIVVPSEFRKLLAVGEDLYVAAHNNNYLEIYFGEYWQRLQAQVDELPSFNTSVREFKRIFFAQIELHNLDDQGRLLLTPQLLARLAQPKVKDKLVIVGAGDYLEIWSETAWQVKLQASARELPALLDRLSMLQTSR